uniref:non-specific serine/threonine protein kinase n=1 Tax=Kalanchoe fedtschenkoi TaxID=63787 RepID=A0A7N0VKA9_KALFE
MPSRHLSSSSKSSSSGLFIIAIILTVTVVATFLVFYLLFRLRRARTILVHSHSSRPAPRRFPYAHLHAATHAFSPRNAIGKGASATVYRGVLPCGKSVAIKLVDQAASASALAEFRNELRVLAALASPYVVPLLGYCVKNSHRILVYQYMPNRSLQEALFDDSGVSSGLSWDQRFRIVQDVARALAYLHLGCDPPVIHGDVKPSNVLLDMDFRARVSDFGLSRFKEEPNDLEEEEDFGPPFSQELSGNVTSPAPAATAEAATPVGSSSHYSYNEVDFAQALQASASTKSGYMLKDHLVIEDYVDEIGQGRKREVVLEGWSGGQGHCHGDEFPGAGEEEGEARQWGKDWWWRQDGSGELCSKDYVTEWIGSQICPNATTLNHGWDDEDGGKPTRHHSPPASDSVVQLQMPELSLAKKEGKKWISGRGKKHRKLHEWWREEHSAEISKTRLKLKKLEKKWSKSFKKPVLTLSRSLRLRRKRKFGEHDKRDDYCDPDGDFSFRRGWKRNKDAHSGASELWSGDLFSRELSSTTSMRGTLCYVAPECGGCGHLMEKADIYSLGVLILVIVSGRRPLHVLSSPMKLEKANLVSWCRHLAQSGNVLELVDRKLQQSGYVKDQATLCINLALACLQKSPELRPDIGDVVKILNREMDMPALPFEFSPSPPPKLLSRSRRRQKTNVG